VCTFVVMLQSSVLVKVDRETGNAGSVLTVAGFDVQVNYHQYRIPRIVSFTSG